jgi:leader peptidase (prepilin peptidase)/N-methyltransferase
MSLLPVWFVAVFLAGLLAGGFVNYCARRLPFERALIWPGPSCLKCFQPVRWYHCLPVVGYALLGGRCRACRQPIPLSYPIVELTTGVLFVVLLALVGGLIEVPFVGKRWNFHPEVAPGRALIFFVHHAILICFLLVAALCDLADMEIPFTLTLCGTLVGLVLATVFPWPFPLPVSAPAAFLPPYPALYPWPVWHPNQLPSWLPPGSPQLGLATGLAGAAAGTLLLRGIGFLFKQGRGIEGMGVGDADLMMMAGAFLGWQMVVMAFFVAVLPGLVFAVIHLIVRGTQALPFGPSLAVGVVLTILLWPILADQVRPLFFEPWFLGLVGGGGAVALFGIAFLLWLFRWLMGDEDDSGPDPPRRPPVQVPTTTQQGS